MCKSHGGIKNCYKQYQHDEKNIFNEIKPCYKLLYTNTETEKTFAFVSKHGIVIQHVYTHVLNN